MISKRLRSFIRKIQKKPPNNWDSVQSKNTAVLTAFIPLISFYLTK